MGLDSVEIVMEVEKAFEIRIPDKKAGEIITVGDFHDLVWGYVKDRDSIKCKSQSSFYKLRQSFNNTVNISKQSINLGTVLKDIVPVNNRRKIWLNLSSYSGLEFPPLILRKPYSTILTVIGWASFIGGLSVSLILRYLFNYTNWVLLLPLFGIVFTFLISKLLEPMRTDFVQNNFRDLTNTVLVLNYSTLDGATNRKEVETIINQIITDKGGLELEEVTPNKKIHDDLGID